MFKEVRQSTVTQKIISQIRTAILEGKLQPGDKLPSEKDLVEQFQVSKQSLREAMRALEHIGLLVVRKGIGGGAFIVEVDVEVAKESLTNYLYFKNLSIEDLSEFRKLLEPHAAAKAAESISARQLQELAELNRSAIDNLKNDRIYEASQDEFSFHRFIAKQTGNPLLYLTLDFVESMLEDFKKLFVPDKAFYDEVLQYHERIYQAILNRDTEKAASVMLAHVDQVERELLKIKENINIKQIYAKSA
jgi:GntR family transcriptional regulator, transcriptional repressor for pyruvate dehydrogenase complex